LFESGQLARARDLATQALPLAATCLKPTLQRELERLQAEIDRQQQKVNAVNKKAN
jgi:hypothetical protein